MLGVLGVLTVTVNSAFLGGLASIVFEFITRYYKEKEREKNIDIDIASRITNVSTTLKSSVQELNMVEAELEKRIETVEKLKQEAEEAEAIMRLSEDQVAAIRATLSRELQKEGQKSFWQGVAVNFVFFMLGAVVSFAVSYYFSHPL